MNPLPKLLRKARKPAINRLDRVDHTPAASLAQQIGNYTPLLDLQDRRQLLRVEVVGSCHPQTYQSMILGIDFVHKHLILDSLSPINPYCPIVVGDRLQVSHQQFGQVLNFSGELIDVDSENGHLNYLMALPTQIAYTQRRFFPRLDGARLHAINCDIGLKIRSPLKMPWYATLINLSAGGMRVSVPGKVGAQLNLGEQLPLANIRLGDLSFATPLKIKSFRQQRKPYEHTAISLAFTNINPQDRIRLQNFVVFNSSSKSEFETGLIN